jgi:hypothetical protein
MSYAAYMHKAYDIQTVYGNPKDASAPWKRLPSTRFNSMPTFGSHQAAAVGHYHRNVHPISSSHEKGRQAVGHAPYHGIAE